MKIFFYQTAAGKIGITEDNGCIANLFFETDALPRIIEQRETKLIKEAARQLNAYLSGILKEFSLPLTPKGTDFSQLIWKRLQVIPYGKTASYKNIAALIGKPQAARAAGSACNRNPIPIFIPCHRIIAGNGGLGGYRGGPALKRKLLALEKTMI